MDRKKLYIMNQQPFMTAGVEGDADNLGKGVKRYREVGRFKDGVDFSPVMGDRIRDFVSASIYGDKFCILAVYQHHSAKPNTSLSCFGNKPLALDFLVDLAAGLNLDEQEPSRKFVDETRLYGVILVEQYKKALQRAGDKKKAIEVICEALKSMQDYIREFNEMQKKAGNN